MFLYRSFTLHCFSLFLFLFCIFLSSILYFKVSLPSFSFCCSSFFRRLVPLPHISRFSLPPLAFGSLPLLPFFDYLLSSTSLPPSSAPPFPTPPFSFSFALSSFVLILLLSWLVSFPVHGACVSFSSRFQFFCLGSVSSFDWIGGKWCNRFPLRFITDARPLSLRMPTWLINVLF